MPIDGDDHLVTGSAEKRVQMAAATVIRMRPRPIGIAM
jgi:hypothetical protein